LEAHWHSHSRNRRPCPAPAAGAAIGVDVWLIIDVDERPDLLQRILETTLGDTTCGRCNRIVFKAEAPLLLFRPSDEPVVLYSAPPDATSEEARKGAPVLVGVLRERLGADWDERWTINGVPTVPRELLRKALTEGLASCQQEITDAQQAEQIISGASRKLNWLSPEE
jgi:hypothetical protein